MMNYDFFLRSLTVELVQFFLVWTFHYFVLNERLWESDGLNAGCMCACVCNQNSLGVKQEHSFTWYG